MERQKTLFKDLKSIITIIRHLKEINPDIINVGTPKMGLLGLVAAKWVGVNKRIYTCRGFRFEQENGFKRKLLSFLEKIAGKCAHKIICISPSLEKLSIELNVFSSNKTLVINKGSSNGIDLNRFNVSNVNSQELHDLKAKLNIIDKFCYGFVGRLVDDKGINELYYSFEELYTTNTNIRLLLIGSIEEIQIKDKEILKKILSHPAILYLGPQSNIPLYLSLFDVFVMPTHREGFGNVFLEAAAMGIPVIGTNVTGAKDAVCNDYNGIIVQSKSISELTSAMKILLFDEEKKNKFSKNGIIWAKNFDKNVIWEEMNKLYNSNYFYV
jgi:glycosyltransferase involved in cell wall biosynthesis